MPLDSKYLDVLAGLEKVLEHSKLSRATTRHSARDIDDPHAATTDGTQHRISSIR